MSFDLIPTLIILALGIIIGWWLGASYYHWPLINFYRAYYQRHAEERIRQHTQFLISVCQLYAANPSLLLRGRAGTARHLRGRGATPIVAGGSPRIIVSVNGKVVPDSPINLRKRRGSLS
jgi:hypothetical protein